MFRSLALRSFKFVAPAGIAVAAISGSAISALAAPLPRTGTITEMVSGDLMCYVTFKNDQGKIMQGGATFEICEQKQFLNRRVRFTYKRLPVNDCESAEPCGKTRMENLIIRMQPQRR